MQSLTIQFPDDAFAALRKAPAEFAQAMRLTAAVKWYEMGEVSQGQAAVIAGMTRSAFIASLYQFQVSPFQYSPGELEEDLVNDSLK